MIKSNNIFFINILPKIFILLLSTGQSITYNILNKRIRTKLKIKNRIKKKNLLIYPNLLTNFFFLNFNNTLHFNQLIDCYLKKKILYILRRKLKWNFQKFKYHGKGYKIKKFDRLSKITCRFGKSHWTKIKYKKKLLYIKRIKKNRYFCVSSKHKIFKKFKNLFIAVKGVNKYTKRGVRLLKQSIKKRFGKISQASSVYK